MPLESVTYIADLVPTNPLANDPKSQGDDHIRNNKTALLNSLGGFPGAIQRTGTDGGAANAYTVAMTPTLPAYGLRMTLVFAPTAANTGAATMKVDGLAAVPLRAVDGTELAAGDLAAGVVYAAFYNGTEFRLLNPTKAYIDAVRAYASQLAFSTALPNQAGSDDKLLMTAAGAASWTALLKASLIRFKDGTDATKLLALDLSGLTTGTTRTLTAPNKSDTIATLSDVAFRLLATVTPTAAASLDFLSLFTSGYDNYRIVIDGIRPSTTAENLVLRFANGGSVDTASNYRVPTNNGSADLSTSSAFAYLASTTSSVANAGVGFSAVIDVLNANDAVGAKAVISTYVNPSNTVGTGTQFSAYVAANAISGFRLYWQSGGNFVATGKVRVYGYQN